MNLIFIKHSDNKKFSKKNMHYATVCKEIDNYEYLFINIFYSNDRKKHTIIDSTSTSNNILPV